MIYSTALSCYCCHSEAKKLGLPLLLVPYKPLARLFFSGEISSCGSPASR